MFISERILPWLFTLLFTAIGFVCLLAAGYFAMRTETRESYRGPQPEPPKTATLVKESQPHPTNWAAAEGFAIAGGLCLLAGGLGVRNIEPSRPRARAENDARHPEEWDPYGVIKTGRGG